MSRPSGGQPGVRSIDVAHHVLHGRTPEAGRQPAVGSLFTRAVNEILPMPFCAEYMSYQFWLASRTLVNDNFVCLIAVTLTGIPCAHYMLCPAMVEVNRYFVYS